MAERSGRSRKERSRKERKPVPNTNEPWLSKQTGLVIITILSIGLMGFFTWQLAPALGLEALLWGAGFGLAIWAVFLLAYSFNKWLRRR